MLWDHYGDVRGPLRVCFGHVLMGFNGFETCLGNVWTGFGQAWMGFDWAWTGLDGHGWESLVVH